jgi:hypothetical protein
LFVRDAEASVEERNILEDAGMNGEIQIIINIKELSRRLVTRLRRVANGGFLCTRRAIFGREGQHK